MKPFLLFLVLALAPVLLFGQSGDYSVAWIARLPKIDYVPGSSNPGVEGWPEVGSEVIWVAHVRSSRSTAVTTTYRWSIDGVIEDEGTVRLAPGAYTQVSLHWIWTFERHAITFEIDPAGTHAETHERNNALTIHSNALSVVFYVERSYWIGSEEQLKRFDVGAATFDDWMQRRIRISTRWLSWRGGRSRPKASWTGCASTPSTSSTTARPPAQSLS